MNDDNAAWKNLILKRVFTFALKHAYDMLSHVLQDHGERMLTDHRDKLRLILKDLGDLSDAVNQN